MKLTRKQELFCFEYLKNFNATQAAVEAGYSKKTAYSQGQRLLKNVEVKQLIEKLSQKSLNKVDMDIDKAFALMVKHATYDSKDFFDITNITLKDSKDKEYNETIISLKNIEQLDGTLISEIKQTKDGIQIKLPDRQKALDQIGKVLEMFTEKTKSERTEKHEYHLIIERKDQQIEDDGNGRITKAKVKSLAR